MNINAIYFSPTETTKKIVESIAQRIAQNIAPNTGFQRIDFTPKAVREQAVSFSKDDLVIIGVPVYAGRVPNTFAELFKHD